MDLVDFMQRFLSDGPKTWDEIQTAAYAEGFSPPQLARGYITRLEDKLTELVKIDDRYVIRWKA